MSRPHISGKELLDRAVTQLLESLGDSTVSQVLWNLHYQQAFPTANVQNVGKQSKDAHVIHLAPAPFDLALPDTVLSQVKEAWQEIMGPQADNFMILEDRNGGDDEDSQ